jgi:hypothetical protein
MTQFLVDRQEWIDTDFAVEVLLCTNCQLRTMEKVGGRMNLIDVDDVWIGPRVVKRRFSPNESYS